MADKDNSSPKRPKVTIKRSVAGKKSQTVRERASSQQAKKPRKLTTTASKLKQPLSKARDFGKKEYDVVPLPKNKAGRILGKRVRLMPRFIINSFQELKLVTWPTKRETIALTFAVFVFAIIFAGLVGLLDWGFGELFKKFILKK